MDDEVVVEGDFFGEGFIFSGDELVEFYAQVVVLDKRFSFKV